LAQGNWQALEFGITCIDADYIKPGLACFYLLREGDECAVIETGTNHSVATLDVLLQSLGVVPEQVRFVIPTHVHLDHAGGAGTMMSLFPRAQLLTHPRGVRHLQDPARLVSSAMEVYGEQRFHDLYGTITPVAPDRIVAIEDGGLVRLGSRTLEFRHTRGHADHHVCIWDQASGGWFSGDMFGASYPWFRFADGNFILPTTTPTQFRPQEFLASIELLGSYRPRSIYLTHYGELPYSEAVAALLIEQVAAYPDIARGVGDDPQSLREALVDHAMGLLSRFSVPAGQQSLRDSLAFDSDLNAQGLLVWLARNP
jgi:glyoxylase-like metal-dependent hydrolase (beta-lactamase superfamily II)